MPSDTSPTSAMPWAALVGTVREYAIFTLDTEGVIDSWNLGVRELLGYEQHEFVGQHGGIIFTPEDRANGAVERELSVARETGEAMDDRWHLRKDGTSFWANGIMHGVRDAQGRLTGYLKIMRDQTEKRAADERLRVSEERFTTAFRNNPSPIAILALPSLRILDLNDAFMRALRIDKVKAIGLEPREIGIESLDDKIEEVHAAMASNRSVRIEAPFTRSDGEQGHATFAFAPVQLTGEPHALMLMHDVTAWRNSQDQLEQQRRLVAAILDSLPGLFYMFDGTRYVRWNDEAERVTGYSAEELPLLVPEDLVVEAEQVRRHFDEVFRSGQTSLEAHLRTKDGTQIPYLFTSQRVVLDGKPYLLGLGTELREQVRSRQVLERRAHEQTAFAELASSTLSNNDVQPTLDLTVKRVADILEADHVHIAEFRERGVVVRARSYRGGEAGDDLALPIGSQADGPRADLPGEGAYAWSDEVLAPLGMKSGIRAHVRGLGRTFGFIEALSERENAFNPDDMTFLDSVAYLLATAIEQQRLHGELEHRAEYDDLTGLLNRVAFERRLEDALARAGRQATRVAVLFVDLDRFKGVNDTLGHQAGDEVLRNVAKRFQDTVRSWDLIARHGGDEFVLCLPDIESGLETTQITERLLESFREPFTVADQEVSIGATIGVAFFPEDGKDAAALLRAADSALYKGKAQGRSTVHFYQREDR